MTATQPARPRPDLWLPRCLAAVLFGLGALMGVPSAAAAAAHLVAGNWRAALLIAAILPLFGVALWLGAVLWSGRSIPPRFIFAFGGVIAVLPAGRLLIQGKWLQAFGLVGLLAPCLALLRPGKHLRPGKPKPPAFDDELA